MSTCCATHSTFLVNPSRQGDQISVAVVFFLWIFRSTLNVRPYVRPSVHKVFFDFNEIWRVGRDQWEIHRTRWCAVWPDPRSRSRRSKSCENGQFQGLSSANMHVINKTNGEFWYSKIPTQLNFIWTYFLIFVLVRRHVTFKVRFVMTSRPAVPYGAYFLSYDTTWYNSLICTEKLWQC